MSASRGNIFRRRRVFATFERSPAGKSGLGEKSTPAGKWPRPFPVYCPCTHIRGVESRGRLRFFLRGPPCGAVHRMCYLLSFYASFYRASTMLIRFMCVCVRVPLDLFEVFSCVMNGEMCRSWFDSENGLNMKIISVQLEKISG